MGENSSKNWGYFERKKTTITPKIKIAKIGNLVFLSTKQIPDLSCKFQNFTKKII